MKGAGFVRRAFRASIAVMGLAGLKPQPLVSSQSSMQATVPTPPSRAPAPTGLSVRKMQDRTIRGANVWRSYVSSGVIPPFKFCHGRTMVARYPRMQGS